MQAPQLLRRVPHGGSALSTPPAHLSSLRPAPRVPAALAFRPFPEAPSLCPFALAFCSAQNPSSLFGPQSGLSSNGVFLEGSFVNPQPV